MTTIKELRSQKGCPQLLAFLLEHPECTLDTLMMEYDDSKKAFSLLPSLHNKGIISLTDCTISLTTEGMKAAQDLKSDVPDQINTSDDPEKLRLIASSMSQTNLIALSMRWINEHQKELSEAPKFPIDDIVSAEVTMGYRMELMPKGSSLSRACMYEVQKLRLIALKSSIDLYIEDTSQTDRKKAFFKQLEDFDVRIPLRKKSESVQAMEILKTVRDAIVHSAENDIKKFQQLTGEDSLEDFLLTPAIIYYSYDTKNEGNSRIKRELALEDNGVILDQVSIEYVTMADVIINECLWLLNIYAGFIENGSESQSGYMDGLEYERLQPFFPNKPENDDEDKG